MTGRSLKAKVLSRVFSEDYERVKRKILDPRGPTIQRWNKIFLLACLVSLFVDPLFFYLPEVRDDICIDIGYTLEVVLTIIRSIADVFYMIQIYVRFRTAYVAPSSRVFGRGELVIDTSKIAVRYLRKSFWIDAIAAVPVPQGFVFVVYISAIDLDHYPQPRWFDNGEHQKCPKILSLSSVPTKAFSHISALIANCQGYRRCD
ncbi:hypothetical protein CsSME_00046533 [Camellia sinensis var. sinensis]